MEKTLEHVNLPNLTLALYGKVLIYISKITCKELDLLENSMGDHRYLALGCLPE